jgi:hypothetical protein
VFDRIEPLGVCSILVALGCFRAAPGATCWTAVAFPRRTNALVARLGDIGTGTGTGTGPAAGRTAVRPATIAGAVPSTVRLGQRAEIRANRGDVAGHGQRPAVAR